MEQSSTLLTQLIHSLMELGAKHNWLLGQGKILIDLVRIHLFG